MGNRNILTTLGFALGISDQVSSALWREFLGEVFTQPQFLALSELSHSHGIGHYELAERVGIDKVTIGPIVKKLTEQGWIVRGSDPKDARRSVLTIASAGQALLRASISLADQMTEELMAPLTVTEQAVVVQAWATIAQLSQAPVRNKLPRMADDQSIPPPDHYPWYFLRIARRSFRRVWRDLLGETVSPSQFAIMHMINTVQPIDIRSAAEGALVEETTAIRIVMKAIRTRLIKDRADPLDARRSLLTLTSLGFQEVDRIERSLAEIEARFCADIPQRALAEVHRLTRSVGRLPPL